MKKRHSDMKIDISELFGGDVTPIAPEKTVEEVPAAAAPEALPEMTVPVMTAPTPEVLERIEPIEPVPAPLETMGVASPQRLPEAAVAPPVPEEIAPAGETIDFNATFAKPFVPGIITVKPAPSIAPLPEIAKEKPAPVKMDPDKRLQDDRVFIALYDEARLIIANELKDLVGIRKTMTMLQRTVELAREKHPEIFRNANWDKNGNLLEDGSLEGKRLVENAEMVDPDGKVAALDNALDFLMDLRMQAVEKGLGAGLKNRIRARLLVWINEKIKQAEREGADTAAMSRFQSCVD